MLEEPKFNKGDLVVFKYDERIAYGRILNAEEYKCPLYSDNMPFMDLNRVAYKIETSDPDILPKGVYYKYLYIKEDNILCEFKPKFNIGEEVSFADQKCRVKAIHVAHIEDIGVSYFYDLYQCYGTTDPEYIAERRLKPLVFQPYQNVIPIPDSAKIFAAPCPTVNIEPIKDLTELAKQYVTVDIKTSDEVMKKMVKDIMNSEVKRMFDNIKIYNFETSLYSGGEDIKCRLDFSTSYKDAANLRNIFDMIYDPDIADAVAYGISNCLSKPGSRKSGRYPWGDASAIKFQGKYYKTNGLPVPKKVIFNGPATIVMWVDGTKTVVKKSEDEQDDREKALMYCVFKKFLDDKKRDMDRYLKLFYKVLEEDKKDEKKEN